MAYINSIVDREGNNYSIRDHRITSEKWASLDNLSGYPPFPDGPGAASLYLDGSGNWSTPEQHQEGPVSPDHDPNKYYNGNGEWSVPSDTKNTTGSLNSTDAMYLVGAPEQANSVVTKTNKYITIQNHKLSIDSADSDAHRITISAESGKINSSKGDVTQFIRFMPDGYNETHTSPYIRIHADNSFSNAAIGINFTGKNETTIQRLVLKNTSGQSVTLFVGSASPSDPAVGDIWIDTNEV